MKLHSVFGGKVTEPIPERTAIQQAQGAGVPIHAWKSAGARSAAKTFDDLLGRVADVSGRDIADELALGGTMTNPPPRPALRKAPDADVHPVAPVPAPAAPARPELRPVVGIGGRDLRHPRGADP